MIQNIRIYGDPDMLIQHSPPVVVEFMDKDSVVSFLAEVKKLGEGTR